MITTLITAQSFIKTHPTLTSNSLTILCLIAIGDQKHTPYTANQIAEKTRCDYARNQIKILLDQNFIAKTKHKPSPHIRYSYTLTPLGRHTIKALQLHHQKTAPTL